MEDRRNSFAREENFDLDFSLMDLEPSELSLDQKAADRNKYFEPRRATEYANRKDYPSTNTYLQNLIADFKAWMADDNFTQEDINSWRKEKDKDKQNVLRQLAILQAQIDGIVRAFGMTTRSMHTFENPYFVK